MTWGDMRVYLDTLNKECHEALRGEEGNLRWYKLQSRHWGELSEEEGQDGNGGWSPKGVLCRGKRKETPKTSMLRGGKKMRNQKRDQEGGTDTEEPECHVRKPRRGRVSVRRSASQ